jgi:hypothetical protein
MKTLERSVRPREVVSRRIRQSQRDDDVTDAKHKALSTISSTNQIYQDTHIFIAEGFSRHPESIYTLHRDMKSAPHDE